MNRLITLIFFPVLALGAILMLPGFAIACSCKLFHDWIQEKFE